MSSKSKYEMTSHKSEVRTFYLLSITPMAKLIHVKPLNKQQGDERTPVTAKGEYEKHLRADSPT